MLPEYTLSIDPQFAENGEELGIFEIANTANPAIMLKGVAFSSQQTKDIFFADNLKYRIAAPVIVPGKIYRKDEETEEEYNAVVTPEYIESVYVDFMEKRMGGQVFNEEHDESKKPPSYILETWLVENPKTDKSKTVYGLDVPKGSWFAIQQFTNKDVYTDYVQRGLTGFSIHGHSAMLLMSEHTDKVNIDLINSVNKTEMAKNNTKLNEKPNAFIGLPVGETTVGDTVYTVEEVVKNEGEDNEYRYNEIVSMVPVGGADTEMMEDEAEKKDTELAEEDVEKKDVEMMDDSEKKEEDVELMEEKESDKTEETELAEEDVEKKEDETEMAEETPGEYYSKEEVDAKFAEVFDMLAEAKNKEGEEAEEVEEEASVQMSVRMSANDPKRIESMASKLDAFGKFTGSKK